LVEDQNHADREIDVPAGAPVCSLRLMQGGGFQPACPRVVDRLREWRDAMEAQVARAEMINTVWLAGAVGSICDRSLRVMVVL